MTEYKALDAFEQVELQKQVEELQAKLAMQDEALRVLKNELEYLAAVNPLPYQKTIDLANKAISATSADVAAWQEKQLAPLRREVGALYHHIRALQTIRVRNGDRIDYPVFSAAEDVMRNTQATAAAYEKEVAAKALEDVLVSSDVTNTGYIHKSAISRMAAELRGEKA